MSEELTIERLLEAYRAKMAVDGGGRLRRSDGTWTPIRPFDAMKHADAELEIEELERALAQHHGTERKPDSDFTISPAAASDEALND